MEDRFNRIRGMINVVASQGSLLQTGYESIGGVCGWELLDEEHWEERAYKAARLAIDMLTAQPAPAGRMPVIMSAQAGGTMVHEACGHGLEADLVHKGLSVYQGRIGQMVASPLVTVIDDATLLHRYGSYRFDERPGCPSHCNNRERAAENHGMTASMPDQDKSMYRQCRRNVSA